MIFEFLNL